MATLDTVSDSVTFTQKQFFLFSQALSVALSSDANTYGKTYAYYSLFLPNVKLPGIIIIIIEGFLLRTREVFFACLKILCGLRKEIHSFLILYRKCLM